MTATETQKQPAPAPFLSTKIDGSRLTLGLGLAIAVAGIALIVHGINYEVSVLSDNGLERIVNTGLTNNRIVITLAGVAAFVGGVVAAGASWVVMAIRQISL